jgi:hypothetical protein
LRRLLTDLLVMERRQREALLLVLRHDRIHGRQAINSGDC